MNNYAPGLLSHDVIANDIHEIDDIVADTKKRLMNQSDLSPSHIDQCLKIVDDLRGFPMGRFLLANQGGFNGYWTAYMIGRSRIHGPYFNELESFLINQAPTVLATRERFDIFQREIQARLYEGIRIASVPCGLMQDLLTLNLSGYYDVNLIGIDLDTDALTHAKQFAQQQGISAQCQFIQADAWTLALDEPVDILTSNGLNIYEADDDKVTALYRSFLNTLKPGGTLITSFMTLTPAQTPVSRWQTDKIDGNALARQKWVLLDTLAARWSGCNRSHETTLLQLHDAGFTDVQFIDGLTSIFPTIVARKPG
ncbi:Uncharacterised protein [BD1-7 clade bacterium]|uniref:Methyltransferase domain-containing protein n=1 Tax=BD1-7 clade bacterium TaxID=2029982 RepID=A0A5S9PMH3_9GAMM|nr:Uncharacterised protein [BD1-7 clade bacterium]CAA0105456.1 Uncharacterised protein [BD1-7 clade bacterium]